MNLSKLSETLVSSVPIDKMSLAKVSMKDSYRASYSTSNDYALLVPETRAVSLSAYFELDRRLKT